MDKEFAKYLSKYVVDENSNFISMLESDRKKYRIERQEIGNFWEKYCSFLFKKKDGFNVGLGQQIKDYAPIFIDFDIKIPYDDDKIYNEHLYTEEELEKIILFCYDTIKLVVEDYSPEKLFCFILEKSVPQIVSQEVKSGFHIHFPFLFLQTVDIEQHIYTRIKQRIEESNLFKHLGMSHSGDILDNNIMKKNKGWLIYGGRKDVNKEPYKVTRVYNSRMKQCFIKDTLMKNKLFTIDNDEITVDYSKNENDEYYQYFLPYILDIHPGTRSNFNIKKNIECLQKKKLKKAKDVERLQEHKPVEEVMIIAKRLMLMIDLKRSDNYDDWIRIGWILYNIGEGCEEAFDLWNEFSKQTSRDNYSEAYCLDQWNHHMRIGNMTIGSLRHFAEIDNPEMYREYMIEEHKQQMEASLTGSQTEFAKQLYEEFGNRFVLSDLEKDTYYEFTNHRWHKRRKGITLRSKILHSIVPKYVEEAKKQYELMKNDADVAKAMEQKKKIDNIIGKLNSAGFKNNIMKECQEFFYQEDFENKLDQNEYLLGFENGVLDLKEMRFREGKQEDLISKSTGYDYKDFDEEDDEVLDVKDFLVKVFPDPQLLIYFVEYCAKLLRGGNFDKTFTVFTGASGDNGKSLTTSLIEKTLGREYSIKFPTTTLTGKRTQSSQASPELDRINGVRYGVLQEPEKGDRINTGMMKELTGNDTMFIRGLFKDGKDVLPMLKLVFVCNHLPNLPADDQATWNRVRVVPFESRFPKEDFLVPHTFEEQMAKKIFKRDPDLNEKLPGIRQAFMWMCFKTYKKILKYGSSEDPLKVTEATLKYREKNDYYLHFVNEMLIKDDSLDNPGLNLNELYNKFKEFYAEWYNETRNIPSKQDLRDEMYNKIGVPQGGKWKKWRFRRLSDDEQEEKAIVLREEDFETDE